jgi:hypothetical protein
MMKTMVHRWSGKRDSAPLKANVPIILKFDVKDKTGAAANDLEPYVDGGAPRVNERPGIGARRQFCA